MLLYLFRENQRCDHQTGWDCRARIRTKRLRAIDAGVAQPAPRKFREGRNLGQIFHRELHGKTLNDLESVRKNYQNMINDFATEATTTSFPFYFVGKDLAVQNPPPE